MSAVESVVPLSRPYKGLDYFEEADQYSFAGRKREITQVAARIATQKCLVIYGRSGLGKTSLLKAGIFPQLRLRGFLPIYVRTLESPGEDLHRSVLEADRSADPSRTTAELLRSIRRTKVPVIVFDQFEEFFIRFSADPHGRAQFIQEVSALIADPSGDIRVVFSLREEYLHALDGFQKELPDLFTDAYRLVPLTALSAREAIITPLLANSITYDEPLITRLVDELARFDFDSARLQVTCEELCESALGHARHKHLSGEDFVHLERDLTAAPNPRDEAAGTADLPAEAGERASALSGIFRRYLTRNIHPIQETAPTLARLVLETMITREQTKYAVSLPELCDYDFGTREELLAVLEALEAGRIVRGDLRSGVPWYELRHECLVPEVRRWLAEDEEFKAFQSVRRIVLVGGEQHREDPSVLLTREQLQRVAKHRTRLRPTPEQTRFLLMSALRQYEPAEIEYWGRRFGWRAARDLVSDMLRPKVPALNAIRSAECFKDDPGPLVGQTLAIALNERLGDELQRAAGRSFAAIADDAAIRDAIKDPRHATTSLGHLHLLADLYEIGKLPAASRWATFRARRWAIRRRAQRWTRDHVDKWALRPWVTGFFAGLAWVPTCALPLALVYACFVPHWRLEHVSMPLLQLAGVAGAVAALVASWLGARLIAAASIDIARTGEVRPLAIVMRSGVILALMIGAGLAALPAAIFDFKPPSWWESMDAIWIVLSGLVYMIALGLVACGLQALVGVVTRFTVRRMKGADRASLWGAMLVPAIAAATFLVVLPLCALWGMNWLWLRGSRWDSAWTITALFVPQLVMTLVAMVTAVTLARTRQAVSRPPIVERVSKTFDIAVVVLVWAAGLSFPALHTDMWPWLTKVERLPEGAHSIEWVFTSWPQTKKWKLGFGAGPALIHYEVNPEVRWSKNIFGISDILRITATNGLSLAFGDFSSASSENIMYAADASLSAMSSDVALFNAPATSHFRLTMDRIQTPDCESSGKVRPTDELTYLCRLIPGADGVLRGSLELDFDEKTSPSQHMLQFALRYGLEPYDCDLFGDGCGSIYYKDDQYIGNISVNGIAREGGVNFGLDKSGFLPVQRSSDKSQGAIPLDASTRHWKIDLALRPNSNQSVSTAPHSAPNAPAGADFVVAILVKPLAPDKKGPCKGN